MRHQEIVLNAQLKANTQEVFDLKKYYPLGDIEHTYVKSIEYYHVNQWIEIDSPRNFDDVTARFIRLTAIKDDSVTIKLGKGYVATKDLMWEKPFNRTNGWSGADGIFSFNIENGVDSYDNSDAKTLFVFGDTLIGKANPITKKRTKPLLMPSNTVAYLNHEDQGLSNIRFEINTDSENRVVPFLKPENPAVYEGTHPYMLINTVDNDNPGFISGYKPDTVELVFDLRLKKTISKVNIYNYFQKDSPDDTVMNRGLKDITIKLSDDGKTWKTHKEMTLDKSTGEDDYTSLDFNESFRYLKIVTSGEIGVGNHYEPVEESEALFALTKVEFFQGEKQLRDLHAESNTVLKKAKKDTWFWLQDGVVIGKEIYFLPLIITSDLDKPEGLQFAVDGVCMVKAPIKNGKVAFDEHVQKPTALYHYEDGREKLFGAAIMNNTIEAGYENDDGFIYIYGYSTKQNHRKLHVARVKPEDFENIDSWVYFKDGKWVDSMEEASGVLENISCEMSVSPIVTGNNKGKYLAVFQYNVDSDFVAYSIGESPVGPFTKPNIVYECEEPTTLKRKTYSYNAKAHPHLSSPEEILVTYNVNSYDMDHHYDNSEVYHPRFLKLRDTTVDPMQEGEFDER